MMEMENYPEKMGANEKKPGFFDWLDNFWYHYKWHSIVALFLIFAISVCSFQMCQKESYDIHVLYSGSYEINRKSVDGNTPEYKTMLSSLGRVTDDFDDNGEVSVTLKDLFMLSSEEIQKVESENEDCEVNYALLNENKQILRDTMMYSSYYVCLLSPAVYNEYKTVDGVEMFEPLGAHVTENSKVEFYDASAVYLSSTRFYSLPGVSSLPKDTLVCLRSPSAFASHFNKKDTQRDYERGKATVIKILNYE